MNDDSSAALPQRFFCTLCGREVFKNSSTASDSYHCAGCDIDHDVRETGKGRLYLVRTLNVWRDLVGRNYTALLFTNTEAG